MAAYVITLGDTPTIAPHVGAVDVLGALKSSPLILELLCTPPNYLRALIENDEVVTKLCAERGVKIEGSAVRILARRNKIDETVFARIMASGAYKPTEADLICAADDGILFIVRACLDAGVNVNASNEYGTGAPLRFAVYQNRLDVIEFLLSRGADVGATYFGQTYYPLLNAAKHNRVEAARLLFKYGQNPNVNNGEALFEAVEKDFTDFVRVCLAHGADPNIGKNDGAQTPLGVAVSKGYNDTSRLLAERGAVVEPWMIEKCKDADLKAYLASRLPAAPNADEAKKDVFDLLAAAVLAKDVERIRELVK